jgi:ParB family chromosome partitioning protein
MTATATKPRSARNGAKPEPTPIPDGAVMGRMEALVEVDRIDVGTNVRADAGDVEDLAESIRQHGVMQPIRIRPAGDRFELVYGQRRLAAAKVAGLERIPALIDTEDLDATSRTVQQLVENVQRRDLNPLEEARALRGILDASKGMTQVQLAAQVGRSRPAVTNLLRILDTTPAVQGLVADGTLSAAHAKAIAGLTPKQQERWAQDAVNYGWSAHRVEEGIAHEREYEARRAAESKETAAQRDERVAKAIEKLTDKAAPIVIEKGWYGNDQSEPILRRFKKAGYTNVSIGDVRPRSDSLGCDCGVTMISVGYGGGITTKPGCVEQKHRDAKYKADTKASEQQRGREKKIREAIAEHLRIALSTLDPLAARVVLWAVMDWSLNDWVKEHKGDRKKPDAWAELGELVQPEIAAEIARFASKGFTDRYGVKLDWAAIAEAFGVEIPEPKA